MGMSASQARQIALTARMNDIEYQGQQINQERTTLSNQVNALYNSLLDMSVPTPPSTSDYTTVQYTCNIGAMRYTMGTVTPDRNNGNYYSVNLTYQDTGDYLTQLRSRHFVRDPESQAWHVGSLETDTILELLSEEPGHNIEEDDMSGYINAIQNYFQEYAESTPDEIKNEFYVYFTRDGERQIPHFVRITDIDNFANPDDGYASAYDYLENGTYNAIRHYDDCTLTFNSQGLISNIGLPVYDQTTDPPILVGHDDFVLTATTVTDQEAYNDAFNEYETAKYKYDKKQQEINAKTSIIQREDKNLELKLTRLDNERNALKTELEAVKKVVQDAIESGFKTFSG